MTPVDSLRAFAVVFVAALLQVVIVSSLVDRAAARPDLLLVVVVALGLLRGSVPGAVLGFVGGLVVDLVTLGNARRDLAHPHARRASGPVATARRPAATGASRPSSPSATITVLAGAFGYVLYYLLDEEVVAGHALVTALVPAFLLNVALALPVHALVRRIVGEGQRAELAPEVEVLV